MYGYNTIHYTTLVAVGADEDMYSLLENAKFVDSNRDAKLSNEELYEWVKMAYRWVLVRRCFTSHFWHLY